MRPDAEATPLRCRVYPLLITVAAAALTGRILGVARVYEPAWYRDDPAPAAAAVCAPVGSPGLPGALPITAAAHEAWSRMRAEDYRPAWPAARPLPRPTFGSNDHSRWATVRALVDEGTYAIGYRETDAATGRYRDYGIVTEDGWQTIDRVLPPQSTTGPRAFYSSKPPLLATLMAGEYWLLKRAFGWSITRDRWAVVRTILITFNVVPFVVYLAVLARLAEWLGATDWGRLFVVAGGCFATFVTTFSVSANNHSVAAWSCLLALYPALRIWHGSRAGWRFALAGFFAGFTACNELPAASFAAAILLLLLWKAPARTLTLSVPCLAVPVAAFLLTNYLAIGRLSPAYTEVGSPWYQYPGSYWEEKPGNPKHGIDWAGEREGRAAYAFHFLLGHHGFFSLSPIFLLAAFGMALSLSCRSARPAVAPDPRLLFLLTLGVSIVVMGFYVGVVSSRNYGGWTSGPRWLIWLTPLWLGSLLPTADVLAGRRWGRGLACLALALSIISVVYPIRNPWRHPWLYDWMESRGWVRY